MRYDGACVHESALHALLDFGVWYFPITWASGGP
jgi:hypothetical protein